MAIANVGPLETDEIKTVVFDFSTEVDEGIVLNTPVVTVTVLDGTDASPSNVKQGAAVVNGQYVTQQVKPGVAGVHYRLRCTVLDQNGNKHGITAHMKVIPG